RPRPAAVAPGGASAELAVIPAGDPGRGEAGGDPVGGLGGGGGAQVGGWRGSAVAQGEGDADVEDLGGVADQLGVAFKAGAAELLVGVAGLGQEGGPGVALQAAGLLGGGVGPAVDAAGGRDVPERGQMRAPAGADGGAGHRALGAKEGGQLVL